MRKSQLKEPKPKVLDLSGYRKRNLLSLVAFGAHTASANLLRSHFETRFGIKTLYVYEYFCDDPIRRDVARAFPLGVSAAVYAPFLERVLAAREFIAPLNTLLQKIELRGEKSDIPKLVSSLALEPNQESILRKEWYQRVELQGEDNKSSIKEVRHEILISDVATTMLGNLVFRAWLNNSAPSFDELKEEAFVDTPEFMPMPVRNDNRLMCGYLNREMAHGDYLNGVKNDLAAWLAEYLLVVHPWKSSRDKRVGFLAVPIASSALFFGYLFVLFPPLGGNRRLADELFPEVMSLLPKIDSLYVSSLALFHNYWAENILHKFLEEGKDIKDGERRKRSVIDFMVKRRKTFIFSAFESNNGRAKIGVPDVRWSGVEKQLQGLWAQRARLIDPEISGHSKPLYANTEDSARFTMLRDSLIFRKYLVAAPAMIACVQDAMKLNLNRHGKALPCALIVGEAGSGKDQMSQIVKTFSYESYAFGAGHVLNMATLRPRAVVAPLLLGVDVSPGALGKFDGWLAKLAKSPHGKSGWKNTLIFDELNSLDIENQGTLLRVLENAEIVPLGGVADGSQDLDVLIIAIMNEDPEKITWHPAIEALREGSIFSGILGELLREYVFRLRRLRDDLYFRLVRGGRIVIPPLRRRAEDIPILFYFYADEELRRISEYESIVLDVDFDSYEYLMDRRFAWSGNIRELQKVAKDSLTIALADFESRGDGDTTLVIARRHVQAAKEN